VSAVSPSQVNAADAVLARPEAPGAIGACRFGKSPAMAGDEFCWLGEWPRHLVSPVQFSDAGAAHQDESEGESGAGAPRDSTPEGRPRTDPRA
jgi:hypothetical protein